MFELLHILMKYDTLLFDLDGTLFSQADYDYRVFRSFFQNETIAAELTHFKASLGYSHPHVFDLFATTHPHIHFSCNALIDFYRTYLPDLSTMATLTPLLSELSSKRMILITNGTEEKQRYKLKALYLERFFESIIILDPHRNDPLKPSPHSFLAITPVPVNAVMIGDQTATDGIYASNCQLPFICFQFPTDISPKE